MTARALGCQRPPRLASDAAMGNHGCGPLASGGRPGAVPRDVLERPYTAGGGGVHPLPPLLPFQCSRLTAKILLRRLRCQEDLRFKMFGPLSAGTTGGPWEEGRGSQPNPPSPPFRPRSGHSGGVPSGPPRLQGQLHRRPDLWPGWTPGQGSARRAPGPLQPPAPSPWEAGPA